MKFVKEKKKSFLLLVFIQQKIDSSCDHFTEKELFAFGHKKILNRVREVNVLKLTLIKEVKEQLVAENSIQLEVLVQLMSTS